MEGYLNKVTNVGNRIHLSKMRLSNHVLNIEKGRHNGLKIFERECKLCPGNIVEDEMHFLLSCKTLNTLREKLIAETRNTFPRFCDTSKEQQMIYLLSDNTIASATGTFIKNGIELREFIMNKHKNIT